MSISNMIANMHYKDSMTVKRNSEITKPNGATAFSEVDVYTGIRCQLVKKTSIMNTEQTETLNNVFYDAKLICEPQYIIEAGDRIILTTRNGATEEYRAGSIAEYDEHNEVPLERREEA